MGMVAVAVCTPPIGLGLATFVQKYKFNHSEREMGKASFTMGLFGITEGAIPFAAQDPLRIIPKHHWCNDCISHCSHWWCRR